MLHQVGTSTLLRRPIRTFLIYRQSTSMIWMISTLKCYINVHVYGEVFSNASSSEAANFSESGFSPDDDGFAKEAPNTSQNCLEISHT